MPEHDWITALSTAIGAEPTTSPGSSGAVDGETDPATIDLGARVARVEHLLAADLGRLGPAVVADSIVELKARIDLLAGRHDAMIAVAGLVGGDVEGADVAAGSVAVAPTELLNRVTRAVTDMGRRLTDLRDHVEHELQRATEQADRMVEQADRMERALQQLEQLCERLLG